MVISNPLQAAYRRGNSAETALGLFRIIDSQYEAAEDKRRVTAAFNTISHSNIRRSFEMDFAVRVWFAENELLLKVNKSDVLFFGTSAQLRAVINVVSCWRQSAPEGRGTSGNSLVLLLAVG